MGWGYERGTRAGGHELGDGRYEPGDGGYEMHRRGTKAGGHIPGDGGYETGDKSRGIQAREHERKCESSLTRENVRMRGNVRVLE